MPNPLGALGGPRARPGVGTSQAYPLYEDYANVTGVEIVEDFRSTHAVMQCTFQLSAPADLSEEPPLTFAGIDWEVVTARVAPAPDGNWGHSVLCYPKGTTLHVSEPQANLDRVRNKLGVPANRGLYTSIPCKFPVSNLMVAHLFYRWRLNSMELNAADPGKFQWIYNGLSGLSAGVLGITAALPPIVADLAPGIQMGIQQSLVMDKRLSAYAADQPPFKTKYLSFLNPLFNYKFEVHGPSPGVIGAMYSFQNGLPSTDEGAWMLIRQVYRQSNSPHGWHCVFARVGL